MKQNSLIFRLLIAVSLLLALTCCHTVRKAETGMASGASLSSKVRLTVPHKDAVMTVNGTMKLVSGQRVQLSFLMPILRTEVARVDVTPDEVLLVDRMGKRYARIARSELKGLLPRKADFEHLEKMLYKASLPQGKKTLEGKELGFGNLDKLKIELSDFSDKPLTLVPTEVSSKYRKVELEEILELLMDLSL